VKGCLRTWPKTRNTMTAKAIHPTVCGDTDLVLRMVIKYRFFYF
jgi:hypothetical protein